MRNTKPKHGDLRTTHFKHVPQNTDVFGDESRFERTITERWDERPELGLKGVGCWVWVAG